MFFYNLFWLYGNYPGALKNFIIRLNVEFGAKCFSYVLIKTALFEISINVNVCGFKHLIVLEHIEINFYVSWH